MGKIKLNGDLTWMEEVGTTDCRRILDAIKKRQLENYKRQIILRVSSLGGWCEHGFSFHDFVKYDLKPNIEVRGGGRIESMGIIIFLSAPLEQRFILKNTIFAFHEVSASFQKSVTLTATEYLADAKETMRMQNRYAHIVSKESEGMLSKKNVLDFMRSNRRLYPRDIINFGLAADILE